MYSISSNKYINKKKLVNKAELLDIDGFLMASERKVFKIQGAPIREIRVVNKKLANPLASKMAFQKFDKLMALLTDLLVEDDGSGDSYREVLNQIEKFRMEIKNRYRDYLLQKELEQMSKKLTLLQKESKQRLEEIQYSYLEYQNDNKKSR